MHLVSTRTEALLLGTLTFFIVGRHLLADGPTWPEPLELYTIVELVLRAAKRKPYNAILTEVSNKEPGCHNMHS
jgi:hypothetical protein